MDYKKLEDELIHDEGIRYKPYRDSVGILTIGVGRNLEDVGLRSSEIMQMLTNDIHQAEADLIRLFPWFIYLNDVRQRVLVNMAFMGVGRLIGFRKMLAAIANEQWTVAAAEMLDSKWARQVGNRAIRLAKKMETGHD